MTAVLRMFKSGVKAEACVVLCSLLTLPLTCDITVTGRSSRNKCVCEPVFLVKKMLTLDSLKIIYTLDKGTMSLNSEERTVQYWHFCSIYVISHF